MDIVHNRVLQFGRNGAHWHLRDEIKVDRWRFVVMTGARWELPEHPSRRIDAR
jgi:hypothetical protein